MHSVKISFLNSGGLLTSSVIQNICIWWPNWYQNRWPRTVYDCWPAIFSVGFFGLSPFFTRPCYGFLSVLPSVRPSVSRKVCPRRRAVSLRQLSFLLLMCLLSK